MKYFRMAKSCSLTTKHKSKENEALGLLKHPNCLFYSLTARYQCDIQQMLAIEQPIINHNRFKKLITTEVKEIKKIQSAFATTTKKLLSSIHKQLEESLQSHGNMYGWQVSFHLPLTGVTVQFGPYILIFNLI